MSDDNLPALYEELERLATEAEQWATVEASDSTTLVHVGSTDPEKMRERMVETRREASHRSKELRDAADKVRNEIRAELDRQRGEMEARMQAAMAMLEPLQEQVKRMEEGIWTVNLYLGTSEQIVTLREGQPARKDTPITLRTSVLAMDEETAAFPVIAGQEDVQGIDFRSMDVFDEWIAQPEALQQVLPEERGVVVLRPRRTPYHYDDNPLVNDEKNEENRASYWLIRNGDNLYRMRTQFRVGDNLMPTSAEFTALFQRRVHGWHGKPDTIVDVLPGTPEWAAAEKAQGAVQRHYMRVALILQGLIDRTDVFDPLPGAVNVMQQSAYDDGLVVVVNDTENTLTTSREPYYEWIKRLNRDLRPGMRIMGTFRGNEWERTEYGERFGPTKNERLSPPTAERPPENTLLTIDAHRTLRSQKGLVVKYPRGGKVYDPDLWVPSETRPGYGHRGGYKAPKRRASAVILPDDVSVIPFDVVTEEEMQQYLDARTERHAYADSFPLLHAAIKAKRDEREAEAPFRELLMHVLADDNDQNPFDVEPHIDALVHRFKLGNKWHRPLVSLSQEEEAKALRLIRAEYKRIATSGADADRDAAAVARLREMDQTVMFVGRLSSGKYVAFAPQPRDFPEDAASHNLWVTEHTMGKTAKSSVKTREWITPGVRGNKMTTLFETEQWTGWDRLSDEKSDLTDPEAAEMLAEVWRKATAEFDGTVLAVEHDRKKRKWTVWGADFARPAVTSWRNPANADKITFTWERASDGLVLSKPWHKRAEFELAYGGNRGLGSGIDAHERAVGMPWRTGQSRMWEPGVGEQATKPTVVFEAEPEALAEVVAWVRDMQAAADEWHDISGRVSQTLREVNRLQCAEQIAVIKAAFLAEYPDEDMWAENRKARTANVHPLLDLTKDSHFMVRGEVHHHKGGGSSYSLHNRTDGARDLGATLRALAVAGHRSWSGLTIEGVYALADKPLPDTYEPIKHIVLPDIDAEDEDDDED